MNDKLMDLIVERDGIRMQRIILNQKLKDVEIRIAAISPNAAPWMKIEEVTKRHEHL